MSLLSTRARRAAIVATLSAGALILAGFGPAVASASPHPSPHRGILGASSESALPGQYLVKLKDNGALRKDGIGARAKSLSGKHKGTVNGIMSEASKSFSVAMTVVEAGRLADDPDVDYVQQMQTYQLGDEQPAPPSWGLDRIDQRATQLSTNYNYAKSAGEGVRAYVIDSGVRIHPDILGRVTYAINTRDGSTNADDCSGHGSHVAGTIGGTKYGVAKKVQIVSVKVFGCDGNASDKQIVDGIDWVTKNGVKPGVINMSIWSTCKSGGVPVTCPAGSAQGIKDAEARAVAAGFTVVTIAGNANADACSNPIGSAGVTINVGSTDIHDAKSSFSNFGGCVDIFAPGTDIISIGGVRREDAAGVYDPNGTLEADPATKSGTSMAGPHVVGAVAALLSTPQFATATPAEIAAELDARATQGVITGFNPQDFLSPNKLLYSRPSLPGSSVSLAKNANGKLELFAIDAQPGSMWFRNQESVDSSNWGAASKSSTAGWASTSAETNEDGRIELASLALPGQVWHRQQGAPDLNVWFGLSQFDGLATAVATAKSSNGRLKMFVANKQGDLFVRSQLLPSGTSWGPWGKLTFNSEQAMSIAAETDSVGRIELVVADKHGQVWHTRQTEANTETFTPIALLADVDARKMNDIALARNKDGRLELVGVNGAGGVWHRAQTAPGSDSWLSWSQFQPKTLMHVAAEANQNGSITVAGVDNNGGVWQSKQTAPDAGTYLAWTEIVGTTMRS